MFLLKEETKKSRFNEKSSIFRLEDLQETVFAETDRLFFF